MKWEQMRVETVKVSHSLMMTEKRQVFSPRGDMVGSERAKMDACGGKATPANRS